jgi:replicative DNA helicase
MTKTILKGLMSDEDYAIKVFPFLKTEYFDSIDEQYLYKIVHKYQDKYGTFPSFNEVEVLVQKNPDLEDRARLEKIIGKIKVENDLETNQFLLDETEEYIRSKDLQLSIMQSVEILQSGDKVKEAGIPSLIESSLGITFDKSIGLDLLENIQDRIDYYKAQSVSGFLTSLDVFNKITKNGFKRKTLNIVLGAPHSGKSLTMTHLASDFLLRGHNVLYITLEMSEFEVAKRIDANLMNININELENVDNNSFIDDYATLLKSGLGKLKIKEFPTGAVTAIHFKALLKEMKIKLQFVPDIIMVDYLGIMGTVAKDSYTNMQKNAEALRAIAVEFDCAVFTGAQTNRGGFEKTNGITMSDIAESTGPLQIADLILGASKFTSGVEEEEEDDDGTGIAMITEQLILINVIKNRLGGLTKDKFLLNQKLLYMRLEEVQNSNYANQNKKDDDHALNDKFNSAASSAKGITKKSDVFDF